MKNIQIKLITLLSMFFLLFGMVKAHALGHALAGIGDFATGAKEWANRCGCCHNLRSPSEFDAKNWQTIMLHMRIQAGITGQKARNIYAFLSGQSAQAQTVAVQTPNNLITASPSLSTKHIKLAANTQNAAAISPGTQQQSKQSLQAANNQSGAAIYHQTCVVCHGASGKGAIPGTPDFTNTNGPLKKSDSVLLNHIINGYQTPGSPMAMPPRGGNPNLTDTDLQNTLSYIKHKFGK